MEINIKKIDLSEEKNILTGCILDDIFCRDIKSIVKLEWIKSPYIKLVLKWSFDFFEAYQKSPKNEILDIFSVKKNNLKDLEIDYITDFLGYISDVYFVDLTAFNVQYYFQKAELYLKKRSLDCLAENIRGFLLEDDIREAESIVTKYNIVEKELGTGINVLNDRQAMIDIYLDNKDAVLYLPGVFGRAVREMYRGDVVCVGAPMKTGKTWMLLYFASMALRLGLTVAFWTLEMKSSIMIKRFWQYMCAMPKSKLNEVYYTKLNSDNEFEIVIKNINDSISLSSVLKKQEILKKRTRGGMLKIFDQSSGGGTIDAMKYTLDNEERSHNFVPDIIITDYLDIVEFGKNAPRDYRQALNHTWLQFKKLAQQRNCLGITASQLGKKTMKGKGGVEDAAEDIRKWAHVSQWINILQTKDEKRCGLMRASVQGRHDEFDSDDEILLFQCLALGSPVISSEKKYIVKNYDEKVKELSKKFYKIKERQKNEIEN